MIRQDADGGRVQESRTMGATAAMERAEATAIRRASRTRIGAATVSRVCAEPETVNEQDSSFDGSVSKLLQTSERTLLWVAHQLDGLTLPGLSDNKRRRLAAGCLHIAIEHAQAIVVLTQEKCFGSALALQRPLIEAWAAGLLAVLRCNRGRCRPRRAGQIPPQQRDHQGSGGQARCGISVFEGRDLGHALQLYPYRVRANRSSHVACRTTVELHA